MRGTLLLGRVISAPKNPHAVCPGCQRTFCAEESAGDVKSFASYYHDLLTIEQLLSHSAGQATQEMSLAIDNDLVSKKIGCQLGHSSRFETCGEASKTGHRQTYNWFESRHPSVLSLKA